MMKRLLAYMMLICMGWIIGNILFADESPKLTKELAGIGETK